MKKNERKSLGAVVDLKASEEKNTSLQVIKPDAPQSAEETSFEEVTETRIKPFPNLLKFISGKYSLIEKYELLNQTEKTLDSFNLGKEGLADNLQIRDGKGKTFTTSNSDIIREVVEVIRRKVQQKINEVELAISDGL